MKNKEIRQAIEESGLRYWEVAESLGIADCSFSRKLRRELSDDEKERILKIISDLKKGGAK